VDKVTLVGFRGGRSP